MTVLTGIIECKNCGRFRGAEHPRCEVCGSDWKREVEVEVTGSTSDGFHTFDELYEFRMLYHAAFVNALAQHAHDTQFGDGQRTVKSMKHSDGELCFGGGWFIVVTDLPAGQISNHYEVKHWDLFKVPAVDTPPAFDGHTPDDVAERLHEFLEG
jgi:hypothetical protein